MCPRGDIFYLEELALELKPATTFDEQIDLLRQRNCLINDEAFCKQVLRQINYYRFSAYFLPFRTKNGSYLEGTNFRRVYRIYEFDGKMRQVLFSASNKWSSIWGHS